MKKILFTILAQFIFLYSFAQSPQRVIPFRLGNKWGYSDTLGRIKIKPEYDTASLFDYDLIYRGNHVIAEVKLNGKPMVINEKGIAVVPPRYDYIKLINGSDEPTFIVSTNNKFGFFANGKELFPPVSDWLSDSYPGLYEIHINGKSGLINRKAEILIPALYDQIRPMGSKTSGFMDWQCIGFGKDPEIRTVKLPEENWRFQKVPEVEAMDYVYEDNISSIIDSATTKFGFDSVQLKYHAAVFYIGSERGIILPDATKKVYFFSKPYNISYIKYFLPDSRNNWNKNSAAYIVARLDGKYGIVNERDEIVLPFKYDSIEEKDEFFLLKQNGKIGFFVWNTMYPVIEPAYDEYLRKQYIPVKKEWRFTLFKVVKKGKSFFVGENGVTYFKD
jgi:hypothetical protein